MRNDNEPRAEGSSQTQIQSQRAEKQAQSQRAKTTAAKQLYRQQKNASMSPEERLEEGQGTAYRQRKNASMSPEERQAKRTEAAAAQQLFRQSKNATMNPKESQVQAARSLPRRQLQHSFSHLLVCTIIVHTYLDLCIRYDM